MSDDADEKVILKPVLRINGKPDSPPSKWSSRAGAYYAHGSQGLESKVIVEEDQPSRLRFTCRVTNAGSDPVSVGALVVGRLELSKEFDRVLLNGREMNSLSDLVTPGEKEWQASFVAGFTSQASGESLVVGFENPTEAFCWVTIHPLDGDKLVAELWCDREGIVLDAGETLELSPVLLIRGMDLWGGMRDYARCSADVAGAKVSSDIMTGWCSWYSYYGTESVEDILANARSFKAPDAKGEQTSLGKHIKVIQIDDGWNLPEPGAPRNWGDWHAGAKFPQGMKWIADEIRKEGYQPGLWLAPFSVEEPSNVFKEHPDWLVKDDNGSPKSFWGVYALDLTHPEALAFVRETFERVFNEWGYEYIKIDFLLHAIQPGRRHDPRMTTAQALRQGLKTIREVAGNRFILGCGCPMGPALGIVDGMRIGPDVSHRWYLPMNLAEWPVGNCSVYSGAVHTVWRHWMHGLWWQNDPDCILVYDEGTTGEKHEFRKIDNGVFATDPRMGLTDEEAAFWVRMIWLTGGMGMVGESLDNLTVQRRELMEKVLPLNDRMVRWINLYADSRVVGFQAETGPPLFGFFNLTDTTRSIIMPARSLGIEGSCTLKERLSGEVLRVSDGEVRFPEMPPRSGRIWQAS